MTRSTCGTSTGSVWSDAGAQPRRGAGLVDDVNSAVGQLVLAQVAPGEAHRRLEGGVGVGDVVVRLVARLQPAEDPQRVLERGLVDRDLLQAPVQRAVLFDVLELLVGGGADEPDPPLGEQRLHQVREVHGAAGGGAGADHRVQLVDEQDGPRPRRERRGERLEAFLEVAAKAGAGEQRAAVESEDLGRAQVLGHLGGEQVLRKPLDERRLADAGVADEHRVVLAPAGEHLERALHFGAAADERIELAVAGPLREVRGIRGERVAGGGRRVVVAGMRGLAGSRRARARLGNAVGDVVQHVEARDALVREQRGGRRFRLLQQRREQVADGRFLPTRALHVKHRRLQDATEGQRLRGLAVAPRRQRLDGSVQQAQQLGAQHGEVDGAGAQDLLAARVARDRIQQVLERQVGVAAGHRLLQRQAENGFDGGTEHMAQASSRLARSGKPFSRAWSWTSATLVSATSWV